MDDKDRILREIEKRWKKMTFHVPKDKGSRIGLPHSFVAPNAHFFRKDQFYWDSYFIILGLLESGHVKIAKGMVDNLLHEFKRFGIIPSRNRLYNIGISQPPLLTSMIQEVYAKTKNKAWLKKGMMTAEQELKNYWMSKKGAEAHKVFSGLSRYCDHHVLHLTAEHESGWDMTSRFDERCLDFLPVDLNALLYKYETDLAQMHRLCGDRSRHRHYLTAARKRRKTMFNLLWDPKRWFFFDYDYVHRQKSRFWSLAGFYPMWARMVTQDQADRMRQALRRFEYDGGLANTQKEHLSKEFKQWDYPNGWANQQWIVIKGLLNYGFRTDARRIANKWLDMVTSVYKRTGKLWEKYDVVGCDIGREGRYKNQHGFGWTNGVYIKLARELERMG